MSHPLICNFCGNSQREVTKLLAGHDDVHICDRCVELCHNVLSRDDEYIKEKARTARAAKQIKIVTPREVNSALNEHVIGQVDAKRSLSVALYNHIKRIQHINDFKIDKSNILLIGPTGTGKTLMAQTLSELIDVPFVITDATTITESGYAGDDASVLIETLYQKSNYDIEKTQLGIIYVDEIDKKAKRNDMMSLSRDVSGEGVQQSLLKLMEGTVIKIPNKPGHSPDQIEIDTKNILFIVGGAFVGLDDIVKERLNKTKIGFNSSDCINTDDWGSLVETSDVIRYGLIPEFCGRLSVISVLHALTQEDLVKVLTEPKNSLINQYKSLFAIDNIELEFKLDALLKIAQTAIDQNLGARGLRRVLDHALRDIQFELPELKRKKVEKIIVTEDTITLGVSPIKIMGSTH